MESSVKDILAAGTKVVEAAHLGAGVEPEGLLSRVNL